MVASEDYPVRIEVDLPETSSRALAVLGILLLKALLLLPHLVVLTFLFIAQGAVIWAVYWVVAFTGRYPRELLRYVVGVVRWEMRATMWLYGVTDRYPPFRLD